MSRITKGQMAMAVPLTEERRDLAARYLPLARGLTRPFLQSAWAAGRRCHAAHDHEFVSAAALALVEAARDFEPAAGRAFATYAHWKVIHALLDTARLRIPRGYRQSRRAPCSVGPLDARPEESGQVLFSTPDDPADAERAEVLDAWLAKLPARHALAVRLTYLDGKTQAEAARVIGVSQSRVSCLCAEALEILGDLWKASRLDAADLVGRRAGPPRGGDRP